MPPRSLESDEREVRGRDSPLTMTNECISFTAARIIATKPAEAGPARSRARLYSDRGVRFIR